MSRGSLAVPTLWRLLGRRRLFPGSRAPSYCDLSAVPPGVKARIRWPVVPVDRLERSLVNLDSLVAGTA